MDAFLDVHSQPKVTWDNEFFNLQIDDRYQFSPPIRHAPFSTTGEPWPRPKQIHQEKDHVVYLNSDRFRIVIKEKSCDILENAVKRYSKIIAYNTIEEAYDFAFNYNEKTLSYFERKTAMKYKHVSNMQDLEIHVSLDECDYPHLDMDESCKYYSCDYPHLDMDESCKYYS